MRTNPRPRALLTRCDATKATRAHARRSYRRCNSLEDLILTTPSGSFSSNQVSATSAVAKTLMIGIADLPATMYALAFLPVASKLRNGPSTLGGGSRGRHFLPVCLHDPPGAMDSTFSYAAGS